MGDPSRPGLWLAGTLAVVLCCLAPLLLVWGGGAALVAVAGYLGYAWIALPIVLAGLAAWLLWRRARLRNSHVERNHR